MMLAHDDQSPHAPQLHDGRSGSLDVNNASDCFGRENDGQIQQMMSLQVM